MARGGRISMDMRPGWACSPVRATSASTAAAAHPAVSGARRQWTVTASPLDSTAAPEGAPDRNRPTAPSTTGRQPSTPGSRLTTPSPPDHSSPYRPTNLTAPAGSADDLGSDGGPRPAGGRPRLPD